MTGEVRHRQDVPSWPATMAGVVVGLLVLFGVGPPGFLLPHVTVCRLGEKVGSYVIWTPTSLLNQPDDTNISEWVMGHDWNYTFTSGSLTVGSFPSGPINYGGGFSSIGSDVGGLLGMFQNHDWTFYHAVNVSVVGTSPDPCTQSYVAEIGSPLGCGGLVTLPLLPNNSTDTNEPHVWNGTIGENGSEPECQVQTPGTYVWFDSSFDKNGTGTSAPVTLNLCNWPGTYSLGLQGLARIPIVVTVVYEGHDISSSGFLNWQGNPTGAYIPLIGSEDSAYWSIPGGWNWSLAPVGPAAFRIDPAQPLPALLAFERNAC